MKTPLDNDLNKAYESFSQDHDRLRESLMASLPDRLPAKTIHIRKVIGDTIMKNRITKLAAAATVIIVAVMIGISQFGGPIDGASVAWADVIETLENDIKSTNTIHILMTLRMTFSTVTPRLGENGEVDLKNLILLGVNAGFEQIPLQRNRFWKATKLIISQKKSG